MAIEKTSHLYEVLIRFGPEGYRGSHVVDMERVADGETVYAETAGAARAVTLEEVGDLLGKESARLIEQIEAERARAAAAERALEDLAAERDDALARLERAREALEAAAAG